MTFHIRSLMLFRWAINKSFQVSVTPGKHQCIQSSCFFPPAVDGWASALNSVMWVMSNTLKPEPLRALYKCWFTRRASALVPLFFREKSFSTWKQYRNSKPDCELTLRKVNGTTKLVEGWLLVMLNYFVQFNPHSNWKLRLINSGAYNWDLPLLATGAVTAYKNHLGPSHPLQNGEGIPYETIWLHLVSVFPPHVISVNKMHIKTGQINTTNLIDKHGYIELLLASGQVIKL